MVESWGILVTFVGQRVMGFGFFFRLRCFLLVDRVLLRCIESRYYHEFQSDEMLRETRYYEEAYASCISVLVVLVDGFRRTLGVATAGSTPPGGGSNRLGPRAKGPIHRDYLDGSIEIKFI